MPRTTLDIDAPILKELKQLQRREGKSLGRLVSELLAPVLKNRAARPETPPFRWISRPLGLKIDLLDKDALWAILDRKDEPAEPADEG